MANYDALFKGTTIPLLSVSGLPPKYQVEEDDSPSGLFGESSNDILMEEDDILMEEYDIPGEQMSGSSRACTYALKDPVEKKQSRAGQMATCMKKEASCGNDIPQEYFVDRRIPSIFRYPNFLKDPKSEKAYVPQVVSLGPYHSSRANLSGMDHHKKKARHRMMIRLNNMRGATDPDNMRGATDRAIEKIFQDMDNIKNSYEEKVECKPECLAVMLTLDGCFLLEILRTLGGNEPSTEGSNYYEPIFERRKIQFTGFDILNDILKVENQIPLIVLRKLLQLEFNSVDTADKFLFEVLVRTPGTKFYPFDYEDDMEEWSWPQPVEQVHHLLGLLHSLIVSPPSNDGVSRPSNDGVSPPSNDGDEHAIQIDDNGKRKSGKDDRCIPTAVQLSNVGIKFQRCNGGIKNIHFDPRTATIYLPPIFVTDHTEVLFRNLIALELCQASGDNYVTSYLSLMDNLIDTNEDVAVLKKSGIVKNSLGSEAEVAELFNGLCKGVCLPPEDVFEELHYNVMKHYKSKFKVWFAQFIKDYVSSPWKFLAFLGAILALVLTLLQTIYSILAYYK